MGKFTTYLKIVQPDPGSVELDSNQDFTGQSTYSNTSWFQNMVKGSPSRMIQYQQFSVMDNDVEVSRALNTISEEMTGNDPKTNEPLELELLTTDKTKYDSTEVITLKAALSRWNMIHDWESKLFAVCRNTIKYGDVFFRKHPTRFDKKWEYINPKNVVGAVLDPRDVTNILGWQVRSNIKESSKIGNKVQRAVHTSAESEYSTEIVPANEMVQFSLNDEMSDQAPFGTSILASVYKAHREKELLEAAVIIYRIQRAPERRVFYIDVGNMPAQRVKAHLEQYKNDIKQKKIPSFGGGKQNVDSVFNPNSMSEDYFMAVKPEGRGSRIETLPGGASTGEMTDVEYFRDRVWEGLNVPRSYMMGGDDGGAVYSDGKIGIAYIQELRFAQYVGRLQRNIENKLDYEFKKFLKQAKINIDPLLYRIRLPSPSNFGIYRQQELNSQLLGQYSGADSIPYLSKRFIMHKYLDLSDEDIIMNERMKREELGIDVNERSDEVYRVLYGDAEQSYDSLDGGEGGSSPELASTEEVQDSSEVEGTDVADDAAADTA